MRFFGFVLLSLEHQTHIFFCAFVIHFPIGYTLFVFCHKEQVSIRYLPNHFSVRQVQRVHKGRNLPKERVITYGRGLAISLATFLAKIDSF